MTQEEARQILGVTPMTRFDEILAAKKKLKRKAGDEDTKKQVTPLISTSEGIAQVGCFGSFHN